MLVKICLHTSELFRATPQQRDTLAEESLPGKYLNKCQNIREKLFHSTRPNIFQVQTEYNYFLKFLFILYGVSCPLLHYICQCAKLYCPYRPIKTSIPRRDHLRTFSMLTARLDETDILKQSLLMLFKILSQGPLLALLSRHCHLD